VQEVLRQHERVQAVALEPILRNSFGQKFFGQVIKKVQITPLQVLEPILRLVNLQLQRQRCSRLESFSKWKKIFFF
jgi:hypothetical protein